MRVKDFSAPWILLHSVLICEPLPCHFSILWTLPCCALSYVHSCFLWILLKNYVLSVLLPVSPQSISFWGNFTVCTLRLSSSLCFLAEFLAVLLYVNPSTPFANAYYCETPTLFIYMYMYICFSRALPQYIWSYTVYTVCCEELQILILLYVWLLPLVCSCRILPGW